MRIELEGIVQWFPPNRRILEVASLTAEEGEQVRILGASGSGKSVLASILCGMRQPSEGVIKIDGEEWQEKASDRWSRLRGKRFGMLMRETKFFPNMDLLSNLVLPRRLLGEDRQEVRKAAREMLGRTGLEKAMHRMASRLSPLEKCQAGMAAAFLGDTDILIADSFTSGLTVCEEALVWGQFTLLLKEKPITLILLTDQAAGEYRWDKTQYLRDGKLYDGGIG